jgi:hypothetical protein
LNSEPMNDVNVNVSVRVGGSRLPNVVVLLGPSCRLRRVDTN